MSTLLHHLRTNVVAYLALLVAVSGTSYAAMSLPKNSVDTPQLTKGAVTGKKLAKNSVSTTRIKRGAVTADRIRPGVIRAPFAAVKMTQVTGVAPPTDPAVTPDRPSLFEKLEFTLPASGDVVITFVTSTLQLTCSSGSARAGLYVDGSPVPKTSRGISGTGEPARAFTLGARIPLAAGPHSVNVGADCPEGNWTAGSFGGGLFTAIASP